LCRRGPKAFVAGRGWIAVALVIFAGYRPINAVACKRCYSAPSPRSASYGQARNWPIAAPILSMPTLTLEYQFALIIVPGTGLATAFAG